MKVLKVPYRLLFPLILLFCLVGAYSLNNNIIDILVMVIFGILGYLMAKFEYEAAPLILALVLGPMLEENVRQSLLLSNGSLKIFFSSPIAGSIFTVAIVFLILPFALQLFKINRTGDIKIDAPE